MNPKAERQLAAHVVAVLKQHGHFAAAVGGCVRDELLGRIPKDWDVVTSARPEAVEQLFPSSNPVGRSFGVVIVSREGAHVEVATFRADGDYSDGRRPDEVHFVESFEEDAWRRDLTINAMALDLTTGEIIDPVGGKEDLNRRLIRAVGNPHQRIAEDKLRMMRAIRFTAQLAPFGFSLDPELKSAVAASAPAITAVSHERIRDELEKILTSPAPIAGLDLLFETGLMQHILPEVVLLAGPGGDQDPIWHPEGNAWVHTRMVVEQLAGSPFTLMLAGLLHDIGKPATQVRHPDGRISNKGHAEAGAEIASAICRRLKLSNQQTAEVRDLLALHMLMHKGPELRHGKLVRLLSRPDIHQLIALQHADATGKGGQVHSLRSFYEKKLRDLQQSAAESQRLGALAIVDGTLLIELGYKPGPDFRLMKDEALEAQAEGAFVDIQGARSWLAGRFPLPAGKG